MTIDEIKAELKARGMSIADFARKLGVGYSTLQTVLSGKNPLTKPLEKLIAYELNANQEHIIVYKVSIPEERVEEICCNCATDAERQAAIDALLHHNLLWLASIGAQLDWSDEERQYLGLPPA